MSRTGWLSLLVLSLLSACMTAPGARGEDAGLESMTNGLVDNRGADAAASPLAGAFFNDGGEGDVRARTENRFDAARWAGADASGTAPTEPTSPPAVQRLLVQKGDVRVEVARPDDVAREFQAKVIDWGGFLQQQTGNNMVLRLPAARFEEAFAAAKALGRVLGESRSADDVTEEFLDLGIRL